MHVLGELKHKDKENVYITVWRIYSGQYKPNFIRIGWVSFMILQETFWGVFLVHSVEIIIIVLLFVFI